MDMIIEVIPINMESMDNAIEKWQSLMCCFLL